MLTKRCPSLLLIVLALVTAATLHGQQRNPALHQALLDLTNPWTVMCVAAHPDDEDGTTLTVLRRKYGVNTVSLFSTFGEGGQNAVGPELYEELGVIRARETINASEIQGSQPYFLGLKDFGFSKTSEETFQVWNHDEALRRMVLKIRQLRPDVIITNHDTTRGHGHHQATGQLVLEAFDAAADPKRFPEQITDTTTPWQVKRLFVRVFGSGTSVTGKVVSVDPNEVDPVRDASFAEQALAALHEHASQGPWPKTIEDLVKARGVAGKLPPIRYQLVRTSSDTPPLPDNPTTVLDGLKVSAHTATSLALNETALSEIENQPERALTVLINSRLNGDETPAPAEQPETMRERVMNSKINTALAAAAEVSINVTTSAPVLVPGQKATFVITIANAGAKPLQIRKANFSGWGKTIPIDVPDHLLADTDTTAAVEVTVPANAPVTVPKAEHLYDEFALGRTFDSSAEIDIEGAVFTVHDNVNIDVAPAVEISEVSPSPCVRTESTIGRCNTFDVKLTNRLNTPFRGTVTLTTASSGTVRSSEMKLVLGPNESRVEKIRDNPFAARRALQELRTSGKAEITIVSNETKAAISRHTVPIVFTNANTIADLRVAYVPSFDRTLEQSLDALGVEATELDPKQIATTELTDFQTIVIDNRGYEAHPELIAANGKLLEFVEAGGTLIIFYHKTNEWNPDPNKNRPQLAPYPLILSDERVTDETAVVRFLQPRHKLLNFPNRITPLDFKAWIQERGLYYPKEWDKRYTALFAMNDKGEKPLLGGLLVGKYGKGNYIYTSMVWYRQLRAGVPGAYRMFANMISYR